MTHFHEATNENIRAIIEQLRQSKTRVRLFLGNTETGHAWPEEYGVTGYIGRSTGTQKVPLLIHNKSSLGGGAILDDCIVAIVTTAGQCLYKHPSFSVGTWEHGSEDNSVTHNGIIHARFNTYKQADNYIKFMKGERFSK